MNERIRELLNEATSGLEPDLSPQRTVTLNEMDKFAELIVQECCDVLQHEDIRHSGYGYNQGFLHKKIKEHFGVEE